MLAIREASELPPGFERLLDASIREGFNMLERLEQRYRNGSGFDGAREGLFAAEDDGRLLGIAGLCVDPYLDDPRVGRVRHVYVDPEGRRRGVGRGLMARVVARAAVSFERLRLRTDASPADRFYRALGFEWTSEDGATHVLEGPALARRAAR